MQGIDATNDDAKHAHSFEVCRDSAHYIMDGSSLEYVQTRLQANLASGQAAGSATLRGLLSYLSLSSPDFVLGLGEVCQLPVNLTAMNFRFKKRGVNC